MLNSISKMGATLLFATAIASVAGVASAAPVADGAAIQRAVPTTTEAVWWRGGWGWWGPAAGFAAGAIIGGALVAPYYYGYGPGYYGYYGYAPGYYGYRYPYYAGQYYPQSPAPGYAGQAGNPVANCARRFRSYDPATGTYLGNDGRRHPCP